MLARTGRADALIKAPLPAVTPAANRGGCREECKQAHLGLRVSSRASVTSREYVLRLLAEVQNWPPAFFWYMETTVSLLIAKCVQGFIAER